MKRVALGLVFCAALFAGAAPSGAAEQTVTLSVKMWCPTCPYIVKRSLARVPGVLKVNIAYEDQVAVVRFDDEKTTVAALTKATADVGFPSKSLAAD